MMCASCGVQLYRGETLCAHHPDNYPDDWASANRLQCDFFHRGKVAQRKPLTDDEREGILS